MHRADHHADLTDPLQLQEPRCALRRCVHPRLPHRDPLPAARVRGEPALPEDAARPHQRALPPLRPGGRRAVRHNGGHLPVPGELALRGLRHHLLNPPALTLPLGEHALHRHNDRRSPGRDHRRDPLQHPGGADTVVETSILFTAFAIASYLYRREEE